MGKYRVVAGQHHDFRRKRTWSAGDVIEDVTNLAKRFPGKFQRVEDVIPASPGRVPTESPREPQERGGLQQVGGEEDVEVADDAGAQPVAVVEERPAPRPKKGSTKATKAAAQPDLSEALKARGKDVSSAFPAVANEGFVITQRGDLYHVYEGDELTPINKAGLKSDAVAPFVSKHLDS